MKAGDLRPGDLIIDGFWTQERLGLTLSIEPWDGRGHRVTVLLAGIGPQTYMFRENTVLEHMCWMLVQR